MFAILCVLRYWDPKDGLWTGKVFKKILVMLRKVQQEIFVNFSLFLVSWGTRTPKLGPRTGKLSNKLLFLVMPSKARPKKVANVYVFWGTGAPRLCPRTGKVIKKVIITNEEYIIFFALCPTVPEIFAFLCFWTFGLGKFLVIMKYFSDNFRQFSKVGHNIWYLSNCPTLICSHRRAMSNLENIVISSHSLYVVCEDHQTSPND